jgi:hypothetical protein
MLYILAGIFGLPALAIGSGVAYVFIANGRRAALQRKMFADYEAEWQFYQRGVDLMRRRKSDGQWEFRAMTADEYREYIVDHW